MRNFLESVKVARSFLGQTTEIHTGFRIIHTGFWIVVHFQEDVLGVIKELENLYRSAQDLHFYK